MGNVNRQRPKRIGFRLNDKEREFVFRQAEASSLSASEFIRRRVLGRVIVPKSEVMKLGELTRVLNELRRLGGLLKNLHLETRGIYSEDTRKAIQSLELYAKHLEGQRRKFLQKEKENAQ